MGGLVHHGHRRSPRRRTCAPLPWRTHLAVVLSAAAIAGCGQAPAPATSGPELPSDGTGHRTAGRSSASEGPAGDAAGTAPPPGGEPTVEPGGGGDGHPSGGSKAAAPAGDDEPPVPAPERTDAPAPEPPEPAPDVSRPAGDPHGDDAGAVPQDGGSDAELDALEHTVAALLDSARQDIGVQALRVDAGMVGHARERACAMAQGDTALLAEDAIENVGLVVEPDPTAASRAMHDWWMQSSHTRDVRMAGSFTRYGVGACIAGERIYYSERFGS